MRTIHETYLGLDLGQRRDFSALAVIDHVREFTGRTDPATWQPVFQDHLHLVELHRFHLGMPYVQIPDRVRESVRRVPRNEAKVILAVDAGGPGPAVVELLQRDSANFYRLFPVIITGSGAGSRTAGGWHTVPRRSLLSHVRIALESQMLKFGPDLNYGKDFIREASSVRYDSARSPHDDLVMAASLALYAVTQRKPGFLGTLPRSA